MAAWPEAGDLLIGIHGVEKDGQREDHELQGEYRLPCGFGFGGGYVDAMNNDLDVKFGKLTYRRQWRDLNYIFALMAQEVVGHTEPGGYVALYQEHWMTVGGTDGEQWRGTVAFIAPTNLNFIRPVVEALYVDNSIGRVDGPKNLFVNGSLRYQGGFLSHPARLGRAMGPQGLEFGNPLGFLVPTWNRRLEVWEMGSLLDFRAEHIRFPNDTTQQRYEAYLFPAQVQDERSILDGLFVGGAYLKDPMRETPAIIGGVLTKIGFVQLSLGVEYQLDPDRTSVVVGLIDRF